jgi:electron transport complex protein RnfC
MRRFRIRGGIHPEGRKASSADHAIRALPLPPRLFVPLQQHIGAAAKPVVRVGEKVLAGQRVGAGQGNVSAPVHAPTSGIVVAIGDHPAPHPSGLPAATVTIEPDGEARWIAPDVCADPFALAPDEIAVRAGAAGIVGLGGAAFPSAVKLDASRKSGVDTLVINGGECEPYLTCDDRIMRERASEIVDGIRLIRHAVGASCAIVGIEDNKPAALAAMRLAAAGTDVQIRAVPAMYPMGWEKQMIQALLGREVPAEGRSADIGVLVHNVATAWAVQQALFRGRPLVSRIVTVSGGAVAQPCNLEVPIGTPVQALFDACGGFASAPARLVLGGPMMGHQLAHTSVPVVKGTSGVLALTPAEIGPTRPAPCIRCASCVRACPVGLLPLEIAARVRSDDLAGAVALGLKDCIACGSCSYVCPSSIPLVHFFNYAKGELMAQARSKAKQEATRKLAGERSARMERIAREREEAAAARKAAKAAKEAVARAVAATEVTA